MSYLVLTDKLMFSDILKLKSIWPSQALELRPASNHGAADEGREAHVQIVGGISAPTLEILINFKI